MFTGIIQHWGAVAALREGSAGGRITIHAPALAADLQISASIAVNGCCLTVIEHDAAGFSADLSPETLRRTTLGRMKPGVRVNLERPLTAGQEFGGHFVQGHVDGVGEIVELRQEGATVAPARSANTSPDDANWWLDVRVPADLAGYVAEKGSIAVDGISLTIAAVRGDVASFAIIPHTYEHTNLSALRVGDSVNLEADILAKYVERILQARIGSGRPGLNVAQLIEQGF